ncbi:hypothetical protein V492_08079, partial [Pseudogymnoascus sp. VKM F-4246]
AGDPRERREQAAVAGPEVLEQRAGAEPDGDG